MGIVASRHLGAAIEEQLQCETGFSSYRIDYLLGLYQSLDRDADGQVLRSELLKVPPVARHPLADRFVDCYLHPSKDFRHFMHGLSRFRRNAPLKHKLAAMLHMYDSDGDGLLSAEQCDELIRRLPATRKEYRAMRWKLKMLIAGDWERQEQQQRQQWRQLTLLEHGDGNGLHELKEEQLQQDNQVQDVQQLQHRWIEQLALLQDTLEQQQQQQQQRGDTQSQHILKVHEQRQRLLGSRQHKQDQWLGEQQQPAAAEEEEDKQQQQPHRLHLEDLWLEKLHLLQDLRELQKEQRLQRRNQLELQQEMHWHNDKLRLRMQQQQLEAPPMALQTNRGCINCEDIAYITRGIDLDQTLSLCFN